MKIKITQRGNVYKKVSWLKQNEFIIWTTVCGILGTALLVVAYIVH